MCAFTLCLWHSSLHLPSLFLEVQERRGAKLSYSGKQRLKQLSKHCQQCSCAAEKDLFMLLCVLSEVTKWRLWFLSWAQVLAPHHRADVSQAERRFLIWTSKTSGSFGKINLFLHFEFVMVWYAQSWFISAVISMLFGQARDCSSNTSCRLLWNSWGMLFFFQMMTLLEFAFKDTGPATRVTGSVCTCQTRNTSFSPVFYWKFRSLSCSKFLSVLIHNPGPGISIQTEQTAQNHLGKPGALNENWWQISN